MTITKVKYLVPGILFPEETTLVLEGGRDIDEALRQAPANAYCFTLFDVEEAPDLGPDFTAIPVPKNVTKRYYIGGELYSEEQVEALQDRGADYRILLSNMRANHWDALIRCRTGNWQPFVEGDTLLSPELAP